MTRWVDRETYENEQSVENATGLAGLILIVITSLFWLAYQGVKRPLPFFVYLIALVAVLMPLSNWLGHAEGIWQFVGAIFILGVVLAAFFGARGPILAIESWEASAMAWVYRRSAPVGQGVYLLLMAVSAVLGGVLLQYAGSAVLHLVSRETLSASLLGVPMPRVLFAAGMGISCVVRLMHHPLAGQLTLWGAVKEPQAVDADDEAA